MLAPEADILEYSANGPLITAYFMRNNDPEKNTYVVDFKTGKYRLVWNIKQKSETLWKTTLNPEAIFCEPEYSLARKLTVQGVDDKGIRTDYVAYEKIQS